MEKFTLNNLANINLSINLSSLQVFKDNITTKQIVELFGPAPSDAYFDPENGYDGLEWKFVSESGSTVTLYARWGQWRIGGYDQDLAVEFSDWLDREVFKTASQK